MTPTLTTTLELLYEKDETAWLEAMSALAAEGRVAEMDLVNLSEYLESLAKSERREVSNWLTTLLMHVLKYHHQPEMRSGSWRKTIRGQRRQLQRLLESGTLRNHALAELTEAYADARQYAADETGLPPETFPEAGPWDLDAALGEELPE
jgi:hypothetical protein